MLAISFQAYAGSLYGTVEAVLSGDRFVLFDASRHRHDIRLAYVIAPREGDPFADVSQSSLSELILHQPVDVQLLTPPAPAGSGLVTSKGSDISLEQLRRGLAWHDKRHQFEQSDEEREHYALEEMLAMSRTKGLWQQENPAAPLELSR